MEVFSDCRGIFQHLWNLPSAHCCIKGGWWEKNPLCWGDGTLSQSAKCAMAFSIDFLSHLRWQNNSDKVYTMAVVIRFGLEKHNSENTRRPVSVYIILRKERLVERWLWSSRFIHMRLSCCCFVVVYYSALCYCIFLEKCSNFLVLQPNEFIYAYMYI